ncbi:MAG: response regulator [Bacteriovoracaceae bacterium]|nr:response regulator [Bacteriovoracaceae bacterium]
MKKKTILMVDDDMDLRGQMKFFLESSGYEVLEAGGESEAIEYINKNNYDLAVIDLMMENQDSGFVLSHKIKKLDNSKPVIIVTGVTKETGIHFGIKTLEERSWIKADEFIQKDLRFEQLKGAIDKLIGD